MTVLALDTSTRGAALVMLATRAGDQVEVRPLGDGSLDELLPDVLAALGSSTLEAVVVLTGPGSYTGVRGGMAAALGMSMARGLPLHGLGTLAAVAAGAAAERVLAVADAGRGGVYCQGFRVGPHALVAREDEPLRRTTADALAGVRDVMVATAPVAGLQPRLVDRAAALAAAVPHALALRPLGSPGLTATQPG